ncbi:MAG: IS91 family transposase, partial [Candidatus Methylomirabilales bacterium]
MLTFTVPEPLRAFLRSHQQPGYEALFQASSQAIKTLVRDPRFFNADQAGFFGVLHTWGRQLQYHPHIHYVVPGGALSAEEGAWHASSLAFFLPVKALSRLFRGKFRDLMHTAGLLDQIPSETWQQDWNVNCQAVPSAEASIAYLAPYVFKVAISDHRILKIEDGRVSFSYKKPGSARLRTLTLDALEFIRRFLQHVLPKGFMKVRYYGFLSPTGKLPLEDIKALVELAHGFTVTVPEVDRPPRPQPTCQACGGRLRFHSSRRIRRPWMPKNLDPPARHDPQPMCSP